MLILAFLVSLISLASAGHSPHGQEVLDGLHNGADVSKSVAEDAKLDVPGLITKYGYPVETHTVNSDGYLLTVHRIPYGRGPEVPKRIPVFLMHGLLSSSADWVIMGPENGLAYILADEGFDVWMGNARGNFYSRNHTSLNPDKSKFWKFSWHEIGYYDIPTMIDYVLKKSDNQKLHYIGHSQGTTSFFVMASERPEYNAKIRSMHALAPVAYMSNLKSPLVMLLAPFANSMEFLTSLIGVNEFLPSNELMAIAGDLLCSEDSFMLPVCTNILFLLCGYNPELLNNTMLPVVMAHTPAGSSSKQFVHYGQEYRSEKFRQYDHGAFNLGNYGSLTPPKYRMKYVTAPVALHYSDNDWLSAPVDVDQLFKELPNAIGKFRVTHDKFNHLDYLWAINVRTLVYNRVMNLMRAFN